MLFLTDYVYSNFHFITNYIPNVALATENQTHKKPSIMKTILIR